MHDVFGNQNLYHPAELDNKNLHSNVDLYTTQICTVIYIFMQDEHASQTLQA